MNYGEYLQLEKLLQCQQPKSATLPQPAHDELLFIITHQTYELWFKQILFELQSVLDIFGAITIDEHQVAIATQRLDRIIAIQRLLLEHLTVLETMTPLDFLDFRDLLVPASGFQSLQFCLLENRLGLLRDTNVATRDFDYRRRFSADQQLELAKSESEPSLFLLIERWLGRTPFLQRDHFDFFASYRQAVEAMLSQERHIVETTGRQLSELDKTNEKFAALFDETLYNQCLAAKQRRLSFRGTWAALFILLYRDEPLLHIPAKLLHNLMTIDECLTSWRYRHMLMVERMIGTKVGTGGSSGSQYLHGAAQRHKIFNDFTQLSTFLIPRSALPKLSESLRHELAFVAGR